MLYATLAGGKRIRPALALLAGRALRVDTDQLLPACAALEMIHTYSLIHDDLPAMDDDDLRRGRPTCHRQFDEATAILAGDALQALAFYIISHDPDMTANSAARLEMVEKLAMFSGSRGMAGGQAFVDDPVIADAVIRRDIAGHLLNRRVIAQARGRRARRLRRMLSGRRRLLR